MPRNIGSVIKFQANVGKIWTVVHTKLFYGQNTFPKKDKKMKPNPENLTKDKKNLRN